MRRELGEQMPAFR